MDSEKFESQSEYFGRTAPKPMKPKTAYLVMWSSGDKYEPYDPDRVFSSIELAARYINGEKKKARKNNQRILDYIIREIEFD